MSAVDLRISILLGIPFHDLTQADALEECKYILESKDINPAYFLKANLDLAVKTSQNHDLKHVLFYAKRVLCEDNLLVKFSRFIGTPLKGKIDVPVLLKALIEFCANNEHSIFFLANDNASLKETIARLKHEYPQLNIAGQEIVPNTHIAKWDNTRIVYNISMAKPHLLLILLPSPEQEHWLHMYHKSAYVPLTMGVGNALYDAVGIQKQSFKAIFLQYCKNFPFFITQAFKYKNAFRKANRNHFMLLKRNIITTNAFHRIIWNGSVERKNIPLLQMPPDFDRNIVCECLEVSFIDSSGLGQLVHLARKTKQSGNFFCVLNPSNVVLKSLRTMKLESFIPVFPSLEKLVDALKDHEEVLILTKYDETSNTHLVKPFVNLSDKTMKKIETLVDKMISSEKQNCLVKMSLEHIDFLDNSAINVIIKIKSMLNQNEIGFMLTNAHGFSLEILEVLELNAILIEAEKMEVVSSTEPSNL